MDFESKMKRQIEAGNFARNNGRMIRSINVLSGKWIGLEVVKSVLEQDMSIDEFEKSMIFLLKAGYLELRKKDGRQKAEWEDGLKYELEVTLTSEGMRLASYYITDEAVEV